MRLLRPILDATSSRSLIFLYARVLGIASLFKAVHLALTLPFGAFVRDEAWSDLAGTAVLFTAWCVLALLLALGRSAHLAAPGLLLLAIFFIAALNQYKNHFYLLSILLLLATLALFLAERDVRSGPQVTGWPVMLLRIQLTIVFVFTAVAKSNVEFVSGLVAFDLLDRSILLHPFQVDALYNASILVPASVALIAIELFIGIGIWFARVRGVIFTAILPLHTMMLFLAPDARELVGIVVFALLSGSMYLLFLEMPGPKPTLSWDERCVQCSAVAARLGKLDRLGVLEFDPQPCVDHRADAADNHHALTLQTRGKRRVGWSAARATLSWAPATFLLAPWLALPGLRALGTRALFGQGIRSHLLHESDAGPPRTS